MGNCCRKSLLPVGRTEFLDEYVYLQNSKHNDIETGGFTDMWFAIDGISDWSNKNTGGKEILKRLLHTYTQHNVCTERNVVLLHLGQAWVFHTRYYSDSGSKFRVIWL